MNDGIPNAMSLSIIRESEISCLEVMSRSIWA